jgi:hypothetical protein
MNTFRSTCFSAPLLSLALFAGCVTARQHVPMPAQDVAVTSPNVARIYVVRDDAARLHKNDVVVYDGELEIGTLTGGTYLCWERAPGRTIGSAKYDAVDGAKGRIAGVADFDCAAGQTYYYRVSVAREGGKPEFVALDAKEGRALVAERDPASHD